MKSLIVAMLLLGASSPALAQDLPVRLRDGATWTITAEHTRMGEGLGPAQNWGSTTVKRLTWHVGTKDTPATITVTPVSSVAMPGSPREVAGSRSLAIPATLAVDGVLTPGPVLNKDEVRAEFARLIPDDPIKSDALVDAATKVMIAAELRVVSYGQGLPFKGRKVISSDIEIANSIGGPPMRATQMASLESFDRKAGRAVVLWQQVQDPEAFKASTTGMLLAMGKDKFSAEDIEKARASFAAISMQSEMTCRHEIDLATGLAVKVECLTTSLMTQQNKKQTTKEHWTITQTLPGAS
jgi:hypothetical protein